MSTKLLDGQTLKGLLTNGAVKLRNDHGIIDDLNVFPVPDGDTGSNMSSTMLSGIKDIKDMDDTNIYNVAKKMSKGLLMGARGNSGVILSQLFRGFAKGLENLTEDFANAVQLAGAFRTGVEQAYSSVIKPVEGTILTVTREAADDICNKVHDDMTINEMFDIYIAELYASLERTPDLLPVLKEAGVVDSGASGYIKVIEGMIAALEGDIYDELSLQTVQQVSNDLDSYTGNDDFGYCTEFIIKLKDPKKFNETKLVKKLKSLGDSLVVVTDDDICKVHVHTKKPGDALNLGQAQGSFVNLKIENMALQHSEALLYDQDITHDCEHDHGKIYTAETQAKYGIITVVNGQGLKNTFIDMGVDLVIDGGQTMNPSTEDFINAIDELNAEHIIIIPNNSNVILSAQAASEMIDDKEVVVLPAKTISQGYASLTMFDANQELADNILEMNDLIENVKTGEVTYAVRDTEIDGVKIVKNNYMGIADGKIIVSDKEIKNCVIDIFDKLIDDESEIVTVMVGEDIEEEDADSIINEAKEKFKHVEFEKIQGDQLVYSYIVAVE